MFFDHAAQDCAHGSSYTLVEGFLKELPRRTRTPLNENEGDILDLYKLAADVMNLNSKGESLESYLRTILQGLTSQVSGFYERPKQGQQSARARRYNPDRHHAKLAVNAAFTLCKFLLDSFEYQQKRKESAADL